MNVESILRDKGSEVSTIRPESRLTEAVGILARGNIGALVVTRMDGSLAGILSERDVVRCLNQQGGDALALEVGAAMTPDPVTCGLEDTVDELMAQMTERRIRHLPVVVEGRLAGIVSIGDVVKRKISLVESEAAALRDYIAS